QWPAQAARGSRLGPPGDTKRGGQRRSGGVQVRVNLDVQIRPIITNQQAPEAVNRQRRRIPLVGQRDRTQVSPGSVITINSPGRPVTGEEVGYPDPTV